MQWKTVKNYPRYRVSSCGKVMSPKGKILKATKNSKGYLVVSLYKRGNYIAKVCRIHRLVGEAFCKGKTRKLNQINHKDSNKLNNTWRNLEWCNQAHNNLHRNSSGLVRWAKGERQGMAKLKNKQVVVIKKLLSLGMYHKDIAKMYGVSRYLITKINTGTTYRCIQA